MYNNAKKNSEFLKNGLPWSKVNVYGLSIFWNYARTLFQAVWPCLVLLSFICTQFVAPKIYDCINLIKSICLLSIYIQEPCQGHVLGPPLALLHFCFSCSSKIFKSVSTFCEGYGHGQCFDHL